MNGIKMNKKKTIFVNFIYNVLYNSMTIIFPLFTIPYVSRIILSDGLGKVNYANNIVSWFLVFASLGIPRYGVREIAKVRKNLLELNKVFNQLFFINFISSTICTILYLITIWNISSFHDKLLLYLVTGIQLFFNIFNVDWFYQGIEEYGYITKRSFVIKCFSLLFMFIFVKKHQDYIIYALIQSLALVGNYIFNFVNLKKYVNVALFKNMQLKKHILSIIVLLSTQLATSIYCLLDTTMLGIWCSDSIIGYYTNAQKIIKIIAILTASLGSVIFPRLVQEYENRDLAAVKALSEKSLEIILTICLPIMFGLILVSHDIVPILFGNDFLPCITTIMLFSPFVLFTTVGNLFGTQLLMVFGNEKKLFYSVLGGAILNFLMNYFFIPIWKQDGAAIASVITEFVVMFVQIIIVEKCIKIVINMKCVFQILIMNVVMILSVILIQIKLNNFISELIASIIVGGGVYVLSGYLMKNEVIKLLISKFRCILKI